MPPGHLLTDIENLILLAVARLPDRAYAVAIREEIRQRTRAQFSRGTIYITLSRLEKRGYLESRFADPTPERGGKAKRLFRLRPEGLSALQQTRRSFERMWEGIEPKPERI